MLTYPRFARACYAFFAIAVFAAILKLSIAGAEPALLKLLPAIPTANIAEPATKPPEGLEDPRLVSFSDGAETERLEDPRLGSFSDDEEVKRLEAVFARAEARAPREDVRVGSGDGADAPSGDAPVFRRPSLSRSSSPGTVCGDLGDAPGSSRVVFPLPDEYFNSYDDTWGAARPQGGHEGTDLMSPAGTPEFALTDGTLVAVAGSNENGWNRLGGYTVMLEAAYDVGPIKKGDLFYYAHLDRESSLPIGTQVRAGQQIGTVGDTGEGREVTRGKFPPHLHLGWYDANLSEERSKAESGAMDPYPLLRWLEENGGAISGGSDAPYCQAPQSPNPAPSTGDPDRPTPSSPGERPDLDTGRGDASPVIREDRQEEDRPRRDHGGNQNGASDGETLEEEASDEGESDESVNGEQEAGEGTGATGDTQDEARDFPLGKKLKTRLDALLRDLPSGNFDRNPPGEDQSDKQQDEENDGDGQNGREEREDPVKVDRLNNDRPEAEQDAAPGRPPRPTAPTVSPDGHQRPEKIVKDPNAGGAKPEASEIPRIVREDASTEPAPELEETGAAAPPSEGTADAAGEETLADPETVEGQ